MQQIHELNVAIDDKTGAIQQLEAEAVLMEAAKAKLEALVFQKESEVHVLQINASNATA